MLPRRAFPRANWTISHGATTIFPTANHAGDNAHEAPRREGSFLRPSKHAESRASDGVTVEEDVDIEVDDYEGSERMATE